MTEAQATNGSGVALVIGPRGGGSRVIDGDEYTTPAWLAEDARHILSGNKDWQIYLDPATSKEANKNIKARKIYTKEDSGLVPWWNDQDYVTVWLNPPYSQPLRDKFVERCLQQYHYSPRAMSALILLNLGTETKAVQSLFSYSSLTLLFNSRIAFDHPSIRSRGGQNRYSQGLFLLTQDEAVKQRFTVTMRDKGVIVRTI